MILLLYIYNAKFKINIYKEKKIRRNESIHLLNVLPGIILYMRAMVLNL